MKNNNFSKNPDTVVQSQVKTWWERRPMIYEWENQPTFEEGTEEFFEHADKLFWKASAPFAHPNWPQSKPFSRLIDYPQLQNKHVLEIGCGIGALAEQLALSANSFAAIDLTERGVLLTKKRLELHSLDNSGVRQADAEHLPFPDESFDFVWSWGVIHHSAHTDQCVKEILRVLKKDGTAKIMVYHRNSTRYYVYGGLYRGLLCGKLIKCRSLYAINMDFTDGYIARHFSRAEATELFYGARSVTTQVMGEVAMFPGWGSLSRTFPRFMDHLNRFLANHFGWYLFVEVSK